LIVVLLIIFAPICIPLLLLLLFSRIKYEGRASINDGLVWYGGAKWLGLRIVAESGGAMKMCFLFWDISRFFNKEEDEEAGEEEIIKEEKTEKKMSKKKDGKEKDGKPEKVKKEGLITRCRGAWNRFKRMEIKLIIEHSAKLLKTLLKILWPKKLHIKGLIGFEDPALTGKLLGAIYAVAQLLAKKGVSVKIDGDFENPALDVHIRAKGYFRLFPIGIALLRWYLKPPIRRLFKKDKAKTKIKEGDGNFDGI